MSILSLTTSTTFAASPSATPPVNDVGPVNWGEPVVAASVVHAPSFAGRTYPPRTQEARDWAYSLLGPRQFDCLDRIFHFESGWRVEAFGGIPQARPPEKMRSAGADWKTNPRTQVAWGLKYIKARFKTPCNAWAFKQRHGWY